MCQAKGRDNIIRTENIAVLGLGNILLGDEGVGVHAVNTLKCSYELPENVRVIDGGTMGLDLLPFIEGMDKVLVVDAVNFNKEPGSIEVIEDRDIPSFISSKLSIHQIGLPDILLASRLIGTMPPKIALIGIQPKTMETGLEMSDVVSMKLETLLNVIIEKLREWGAENINGRIKIPDKTDFFLPAF